MAVGQPDEPRLDVSSLLLVLDFMHPQKMLPYSGDDRTTLLVSTLELPDLFLPTLASA